VRRSPCTIAIARDGSGSATAPAAGSPISEAEWRVGGAGKVVDDEIGGVGELAGAANNPYKRAVTVLRSFTCAHPWC
jgi:hypothetical protein